VNILAIEKIKKAGVAGAGAMGSAKNL